MQEIFDYISDEVKEAAEKYWNLALSTGNAFEAAKFLDKVIRYYSEILSENEVEFLRFYFEMKMEMMKE